VARSINRRPSVRLSTSSVGDLHLSPPPPRTRTRLLHTHTRARVAIASTSRIIKQPASFSRAISTSRSLSKGRQGRRAGEPDSHLSRSRSLDVVNVRRSPGGGEGTINSRASVTRAFLELTNFHSSTFNLIKRHVTDEHRARNRSGFGGTRSSTKQDRRGRRSRGGKEKGARWHFSSVRVLNKTSLCATCSPLTSVIPLRRCDAASHREGSSRCYDVYVSRAQSGSPLPPPPPVSFCLPALSPS